MYKIYKKESVIPFVNISKILKERGFIWEHGDSRGYDVYVMKTASNSLAIRVYTDKDIVEVYKNGKLAHSYTKFEFALVAKKIKTIEYPVPEKLPQEIFDFIVDRGFLFRGEAWRLPNTLLSFIFNKYGEIEVSYNAEEVGTYSIEEFKAKLDSILAYFSNL